MNVAGMLGWVIIAVGCICACITQTYVDVPRLH